MFTNIQRNRELVEHSHLRVLVWDSTTFGNWPRPVSDKSTSRERHTSDSACRETLVHSYYTAKAKNPKGLGHGVVPSSGKSVHCQP